MQTQSFYWTKEKTDQGHYHHDSDTFPQNNVYYEPDLNDSGYLSLNVDGHHVYLSSIHYQNQAQGEVVRLTIQHLQLIQTHVKQALEVTIGKINAEFLIEFIAQVPEDLISTLIYANLAYVKTSKLARESSKFEQVGLYSPHVDLYPCRWSLQSHRYQSVRVRSIVEWLMLLPTELPREILYLIFSLL